MEKLLNKLKENGINYKSGDFKPEIHFFGQIVGASNLTESDGIFCEAYFEAGSEWKPLSQVQTIQTQTGYNSV
jgi:hypothetical protein